MNPRLRSLLLILCLVVLGWRVSAAFGAEMLPPRTSLQSDLNGDGLVNGADMSIMLSEWSKPGATPLPPPPPPAPPPQPLAVHKSQELLDGPCFFVEISNKRFITAANPRGWAWDKGQLVAARGWLALIPHVLAARDAGYTSVWLWELTGQVLNPGGCMSWAARRTALDGWTPAMLDDFDDFCRLCDELGVKVIVYSGCAQFINVGTTLKPNLKPTTAAEIPMIVEDVAWFAVQGVDGVGLDALALLQDSNARLVVDIAEALRADPRTRDLLYACEGWPVRGEGKLLDKVQQQYVSVELLSNGNSVSDATFANWIKRVDPAGELGRVPGRRGAWLIHGATWTDAELRKAYELCAKYGMTPIDWRIPRPFTEPTRP